MMRKLTIAAVVGTVAANDFQCAVNGEQVTADTMESVMDIWAASKRCEPSNVEKAPVFCEMDVMASVQSVIKMSRAVTGLVEKCDKGIKVDKCGQHTGHLLEMMAGLAKAGGKIDEWCGKDKYPWSSYKDVRTKPAERATRLGKCILNSVGTLGAMDKVNNAVQGLKKKCDAGQKWCAMSGLDVMTSVAALGAFLAGAVGQCSLVTPDGGTTFTHHDAITRPSVCASAIQESVAYLGGIGQMGIVLEHSCGDKKESRLYIDSENTNSASTSPVVLALAAALPISAVLSFIAGTRLSKKHQTRQIAAVAEDAELLEGQADQ